MARRSRTTRSRLTIGALATAVLAVLPAIAVAVPASAATWSPPNFHRMISAPSRPGIAAWGLAYNPVSNEFIVGDYVSNQIRRFSREGHYLGDFINPGDNTGSIVSAVAV